MYSLTLKFETKQELIDYLTAGSSKAPTTVEFIPPDDEDIEPPMPEPVEEVKPAKSKKQKAEDKEPELKLIPTIEHDTDDLVEAVSEAHPTFEDVRAQLIEYGKKRGRAGIVTLLGKYGAEKADDLKPAKFADIIADIKAALGN